MGWIVEGRCPFPSLFATRCPRPRRAPSYVVLVQRSLPLRSRVVGAGVGGVGEGRRALDAEAERRRREIYSRAGVLEPGEAARRDAAGSSLLVAEAFRETCRGHDGAVVLVDVAGTFSETLTDDDDDDDDEDSCLASWRTNGATVDLSSDPLGWNDDDHDHDDDDRRPRVVSSRLDDLEAVARSIDRAAEIVRDQNNLEDVAVPIFFDSYVPIVATHGIGRASDLIERLRRPRASSSSSPRLSPVVVPVDSEARPPAHRRRLEDLADAVATLSGGELLVVRKSRRGTSKIVKETQPFALVLSASDDRRAPRIIFTDLSSPATTESSDAATTENATASRISNTITTTTTAAASYASSPLPSVPPRRPRPKLRLEEDDDERVAATTASDGAKSRPRIFLQDDDPEFDDLDEEDPDDDLDL